MPPFGEGGTSRVLGCAFVVFWGILGLAFCVSAVVWGWLVFGWGEC